MCVRCVCIYVCIYKCSSIYYIYNNKFSISKYWHSHSSFLSEFVGILGSLARKIVLVFKGWPGKDNYVKIPYCKDVCLTRSNVTNSLTYFTSMLLRFPQRLICVLKGDQIRGLCQMTCLLGNQLDICSRKRWKKIVS